MPPSTKSIKDVFKHIRGQQASVKQSRRQRKNPSSGLDKTATDRVTHKTGRRMNVQLSHDLHAMRLRCLGRDTEDRRDLLGGVAFSDQLQNLPLAVRERI